MKRLLLVLALACVGALGFGTAQASAANCSAGMGNTVYNAGFLEFTADVSNCTGVSQVQFKRIVTTEGCAAIAQTVANHCATGWWDGSEYSRGLEGSHPVTPWANGDEYTTNVTSTSQHSQVVWRIVPWCGGGTHNIVTQFLFRIKATGGSYGPYHYSVTSYGYNVTC